MCGVVAAGEGRGARERASSSMKARGGLQVRWRWAWLVVMRMLVSELLVGAAAPARGPVVPMEIYVVGERNFSQEVVAGSRYRVEILGAGAGGGGRECLLCCEFEAPAQTGNLTQEVKCGASGAAAAFHHTVRSDPPPSAASSSSFSFPSVCLLIKEDAALSVGGGGGGGGGGGEEGSSSSSSRNWQVEAALSLAMYLKWMRGDVVGAKGNLANAKSAEGSVQTQAECMDSRCRITVRAGSGGPEVATISAGSNSAGGSLEWSAEGGLANEWIQERSLALRAIPTAGQQSTDGAAEWSRAAAAARRRRRRSGRYIRGWFSPTSDSGAETKTKIQSFPGKELILVTLSTSRNVDTPRRAGGTDKEQQLQGLVGTDLLLDVPQTAAGAHAGRRSLQASNSLSLPIIDLSL
jgi:hypothetical protein